VPFVHGVVPVTARQLLLSLAQVTYDAPEHVLPATLQPEGAAHVHEAAPIVPVQLWFVGHIAEGP
jgi:hypothetical protein